MTTPMPARQQQQPAGRDYYAEDAQLRYAQAVGANEQALGAGSIRGMDSSLTASFSQIRGITANVVARGQSIFGALAMQHMRSDESGPDRQPRDPYIDAVLQQADELRAQLTTASQLSEQLIAMALASVAPDPPAYTDAQQLAYTRSDIVELLENTAQNQRQSVASGLLSDAIASKNAVVPALLLGTGPESLELVAKRLPGMDITQLRRQYIDLKVAANPSGLAGRGMFSGGVPAVAAFIQLQDDASRNLAAMVGYAGDYYDHQRQVFVSCLA